MKTVWQFYRNGTIRGTFATKQAAEDFAARHPDAQADDGIAEVAVQGAEPLCQIADDRCGGVASEGELEVTEITGPALETFTGPGRRLVFLHPDGREEEVKGFVLQPGQTVQAALRAACPEGASVTIMVVKPERQQTETERRAEAIAEKWRRYYNEPGWDVRQDDDRDPMGLRVVKVPNKARFSTELAATDEAIRILDHQRDRIRERRAELDERRQQLLWEGERK